jgi:predicted choloylglycine hydrolase
MNSTPSRKARPARANNSATPTLFEGTPCFSKRIAFLSFHRIRDNLPYSAPSFLALLEQIRGLAELGFNAICIDPYEMFPYASAPELATRITWTPDQVAAIARLIDELRLEVIPSLQCLGHVYFILEHPQYAHLREMPGAFQQYCPTNPESRAQVLAMADDLLKAFPAARRMHLCGDECRMLGACPRCKDFVEKHGVSELYCRHVRQIAGALLERGVTPLLWSDMFEHHPEALDQLPREVQIVYWNYQPAAWPRPVSILDTFQAKGFHIIGASAVYFGPSWLGYEYGRALSGIGDLANILQQRGIKEHMVTNWPKFTIWELADWGWFFAAAKSHDPSQDAGAIARHYASYRFGLEHARITEVHKLLGVHLPLIEYESAFFRPGYPNRYDLTNAPYHKLRALYTQPDRLGAARAEVQTARENARQALAILWDVKPALQRGQRQWTVLETIAREMLTRADAAEMALLDPERLPAGDAGLGLAGRLEGIRLSLHARKQCVREVYGANSHPETVTTLVRQRYPAEERRHLEELSWRLTGAPLRHGLNPVVIPVFHNPGPPYERGLEHGRVFAELIWHDLGLWLAQKNKPEFQAARDRMECYLADHFPWLIEEMKGIAHGAGLALETILWLNVFNAVNAVRTGAQPSGCSTAIYRKDGRIGLLKTTDSDQFQRSEMILQILDWNGVKVVNCGWAGTVWTEFGMNSFGLGIGCNSAPAPATQPPAYGLAQHLGCYPLLASCRDVAEAIAFMRKHPFAGKGLNIGCIDAHGNGAIFERAAHLCQVRTMTGKCLGAANHYLSQELEPFNREHRQESKARHLRLESVLQATDAPVEDALKACGAVDDGEGRICKRVEVGPGSFITVAGTVMIPAEGKIWTTGTAPADGKWSLLDKVW